MRKLKIFGIIIALALTFQLIYSQRVEAVTSKVLEDGVYEIEWELNTNKVVDISSASTESGANVQIWDKCNGEQQRFQFKYQKDGYYIIENVNSGKVLDVKGAGTASGTNVQQWTNNNTAAQKWKIVKNENDTYSIISKCNNLFLAVTNKNDKNGANIEVNNKKQNFSLKRITTIIGRQTIKDGVYKIATAINEKKVLDISSASNMSGANVQIWQDEGVLQQEFYIKYDNGYYIIKNMKSGKVLDVSYGKTEKGTNVQQWTSNNTDAQKWVIKEAGDGYYNIISKSSGIYLDVANGGSKNGTNIQINMATNSANQKFLFTELKDNASLVKNGIYEITTKISSNRLLDVSGGSSKDGANIQIWADANEKQQKFEITYVGGGNYKIINKRSGKALTVSKTGTTYSANVYQNTYNGANNQLWKIEEVTGAYYFISEYNGKYLDVAGGTNANGTNVRVYTANGSNSQKFILEQKKYGIDVSHWQNTINYDALKKSESIDFMIIRAGQGTTIKDKQFETNYTNAKKYNIPIGVYLYATAQSVEETRQEANYLLQLLKGKTFELPVFYDVEAQENLPQETITNMCNEFCKIIKNAGYKTGIYASKYYLMYKIKPNKLPSDCMIWVASYGKNDGAIPNDTYKYNGTWSIWQYTSTGKIDGINGDVDYDVRY